MKIEENEHFIPKRTRRPWAVLFALILMGNVFVSIIGNVGAVDIYEPDDSAAQATIIPTDGTSQSHDLDPMGDEDWLNFTIIPGTIYTIETLNLSPSCDTFIELFESDGVTLIDWDDNSGPNLGSRIIWNTTGYPAGYYYVRVTEDGGNGGPGYTYDVRIFEGTYAEFFPPHSDYGLDTDGDPLFNYLVVNVTVNVSREGTYRLYSALYDSFWNWMDDTYNDTYLSAGIQIVEIRFDGWRIFNNGDNGSYNVQLWLRDETWDLLDMDTYTTVFYTYDQFQPPPASFKPPHSDYGLDTDGDTLFNYLVVNVTVDVIVAGNYEVRGYLYDSSWNWIEDRYNYTFLAVGVQIVELRFTGWTIYNNGDNGTYYVNLDIRDEFWNWLDWDTHTTNFYTYDQFQPPPASLTGNFNDYGLDTDGDPYYNYLVIEVEVDVLVAGNYYIEIDLHHNATWAHIDQNSSTLTFLPAGIQTIPVYFDGQVIRQSGYDGPYILDDVWLYDENWTRLDYLNDPYVTAAYNWTEFQPPPAEFEPPHSDYGLDTDSDTLFNYLVVNVTVNVSVAGNYNMQGTLYDSSWNWVDDDYNYTYLLAGIQIVELRFEGQRIYSNGDSGFYNVELYLYDESWNYLDYDSYTTNFYTYNEFQPPPAMFQPPHWDYGLDTDSDTLFNYLVVNVSVNVSVAGNYNLQGTLYDSSWDWVDDDYNYTFLPAGIQIVELRFEGQRIHSNGDSGLYNVNLWLYDGSWNLLDTDTYTTNFYSYDQFQPPPAMFEPPHSDYGLDTDGDFYYNYLIVNVSVNVSVAGNYNVEGNLRDSSFNWMGDDYNNTFLSAGIQIVQLWFEGWRIYSNGDNGFYNVDLDLYDDSWNWLDSDTYITSFYTYDEFQPPPARFDPPHSDYGLDTDGNSYFNYLVVNVTVNVSVAGNFEIRGRLRDSSWNLIETVYNNTFLPVGNQTVELRYEGWRIYSNGDNCSYTVELRLRDGSWNVIDTDTYITNFYTYDQFQPPPAMFQPPHSDYGLDTDGDGDFDYLVVNVTVNVSIAGNYEVRGDLYDSSWIDYRSNYTFLNAGIQTVQLWFEGWRIYSNGEDGPYTVELDIRDDSWNWLDTDTYITNFYTYDEFQPPSARFEPPHSDYGLDTDGDVYFNYLVVNVVVNVTLAGNYNLEGTLRDSSFNYIDSGYNYTFLNAGIQTVELLFEGWRIYLHRVDGPYIVELYLYDDAWNWLDSDTHITGMYLFTEFQAPALFDPPHSDYGLDINSDSLFDYLVVDAVVDVSVPGNYYIYGGLFDGFSTLIDDDYNYTYLSAGTHIVELRFLGWWINNNGVDGPYTVDLEIYNDAWDLVDTDIHNTSVYLFKEFQPLPLIIPPYFDDFEGTGPLYMVDNDNVGPRTQWEWGDPSSYASGPGGAYSPNNCWGTNLLTEYQWGADAFLYMPLLNLTSFSAVNLTFSHWFNIDSAFGGEDGGFLEISTDKGLSWSLLIPVGGYPSHTETGVPGYIGSVPCYAGVSGGWIQAEFDLNSYIDQLVLIRFRFWSEPWSETGFPGWYIDDLYVNILGDTTPPSDISNLAVISTTANSATLQWTAPGDDGMSGTATSYVVKYSTIGPITDANWDSATIFPQSWVPLPGGNIEIHDVTGLFSATQYWFAVNTSDEVPNWSNVSNSASGATLDDLPPQIFNVQVDGLPSVTVSPGTFVTLTATIDDSATGNSNIGGANYTFGPQNWPGTNMSASDGSFDTSKEDVTISIDTTGWPDNIYDLYVYGWDIVPNYNTVSTAFATIIIDSIPPANITDLVVVTTEANLVTLTWTAPGDDGMVGTATSYEIRYSTTGPINDTNWASATIFLQSWIPLPGGSTETYDVTGLNASTQYWFAIKVGDEVPNWSNVSNSDTGTTLADNLAPQISNVRVNGQSTIAVTPGTIVTLTATISDSATGNSDIGGANYTRESQNWPTATNMSASDGAFDEPTENINISIDTSSGWTEGSYDLYVYGWDVIPNENTVSTAYATIIIDTTPPTSSVDTISPYWNSASITVTATASDGESWVESVELFYMFSSDNTSWGSPTSFGVDSTGPWEWTFDFPSGDGYYRFYSIAMDAAGNTESAPVPAWDARCAYDTELPTSTLDTISPYWYQTSPLTITTTADDVGSGLVTVELFYRHSTDNSTWSSWISFEVKTQTPWEWSFDFPNGDGYYEFYTVAYDFAQNGEGVAVAEVICGYDETSPIANAGLDQEVVEGTIVTFDGSGSSDTILLYNLTWTFVDGTMKTLYGVNPTYMFSTPGDYQVTLEVTDAAGNSNTDTMWVNVSETINTGSISGRVTDEEGNPIKDAKVTVEGTSFQATTNETGHYIIEDVPAGTYDLKVTKSGYETETISDVTVTAGQDTQNEVFAMKKSPKEEAVGYWWIILIVIIVVVIILVMFLARTKKKGPESFEDLEALEGEGLEPTPPESTDVEEPPQPSSPEPELSPPQKETPPPDQIPSPDRMPPPPPDE